jgi:hypothetical protein
MKIKKDYILYCGHGEDSTLYEEFKNNPYLEKVTLPETLKLIGNLKYREIASLLNKPMGTVQWIYNNAIKKLRKKVGEKNE